MWICVCVLLLPSGTAMAGEIPEVTINSIEITDVSLTPELNITYFDDYNITVSVDSSVPVHTVEFHKEFIDGQNVSNNNTHYYVNGTQTPRSEPYGYHHNLTYTENDGTYHMIQRPDQLYPVITFGLNREIWYNTPQDIPIWQENYQIFHFENPFTMTHNTTLFYEFNAVPNALTPPTSQQLGVFLVENNQPIDFFETNEWWLSDSAELVNSFKYDDVPSHSHTDNSSHYLVQMGSNADTTIGSKHLNVSGDFWIALVCNANSVGKGWTLKWHGTEIDNNTAHWYIGNRQALTTEHHEGIPDTHVHIVRKDGIIDGVNISFKVTNALGEIDYANESFYFSEVPNLAPNPTAFITPINDTYSGDINITWFPCNDPNGDDLYYTLYLYNLNGTLNSKLVDNITMTYYVLNSSLVENGWYDLQVVVTDGSLYNEFLLSEREYYFEISNVEPVDPMQLLYSGILSISILFGCVMLISNILKSNTLELESKESGK